MKAKNNSSELKIFKKIYPVLGQRLESLGFETQKQFELKLENVQLPHNFFVALEYCGWLPENTLEERKIKEQVQSCRPFCCFNHQIGLPRKQIITESGETLETDPIEFYDYQKRIIENYESNRYYAQNKIRGSGTTEVLTVRHMLYKYCVTNTIQLRKCLIVGGQSRSIAVQILRRMLHTIGDYAKLAFTEKPNVLNPTKLFCRTGGMILALASHPDAPRSLDNVGDEILEEASAWDLVDDEPVLKAFEPLVVKSSGRIGVVGTPKGQRGFFWEKIFNPEIETKYFKHVITFEEVTNVPVPIIDIEEAERLRVTDPDLFAQEFGNQFIIPSRAVFGDKFLTGEQIAEF